MRKTNEIYWTISLPKEHEALQTLDAYCREWGGLSRTEATRRVLLEWNKLQRGQPIAAWSAPMPSQSVESAALERPSRAAGVLNTPSLANLSARAASRVLDE